MLVFEQSDSFDKTKAVWEREIGGLWLLAVVVHLSACTAYTTSCMHMFTVVETTALP